jgi:hypothetical protein
MERASERERIQEGVQRSDNGDEAVWNAYVEELLKAKAKCDELWKEKTSEERRTSLLTEPAAAAAMAGSPFENSDEFGFGEITSIGKERWRRRLQTRLCRAFQGSCLSQSAH